MKLTNKMIVQDLAKACKGKTLHFVDFRTIAREKGAKIVRQDWMREAGAKCLGRDEEYMKAHYPVQVKHGWRGYSMDALIDSEQWAF